MCAILGPMAFELTKSERKILMTAMGRIGGKARAKLLGPARVREIAKLASDAAKAARLARKTKSLTAGSDSA